MDMDNDKIDVDKIVNEFERFIKEYNEQDIAEYFDDALAKNFYEFFTKEIDEKIIQKFKASLTRIKEAESIDYIEDFKYREPFDVVRGMYYNKKEDKFELYPFRVINVDKENGTIELLGLKLLGQGTWEEVKDMKFKFIFDDRHCKYPVVTGEIPDKDRLVEIRKRYEKDLEGNDGYMLIGLGGNVYWTKTPNSFSAWYVDSSGGVFDNNMSDLNGILPYVEVEIEEDK